MVLCVAGAKHFSPLRITGTVLQGLLQGQAF